VFQTETRVVADEAIIVRTWKPEWCEFIEALRDCGRGSLEMRFEAVIVRTCRLKSSEFGDTVGGRDGANLEAVIQRVWRFTGRP